MDKKLKYWKDVSCHKTVICSFCIKIWCLSLDLCVVASSACVCCAKWFAHIKSGQGWGVVRSFRVTVMVSLFAAVDVVTLACQVRLSARCMLLTYSSLSQLWSAYAEIWLSASELCICSCVLSAAAADYNTTVPERLYLRSTWEHCHPLWGQRETSSKVRPSFCCTFISKLIHLRWLPELEAVHCIHTSILCTFKNFN